ncbi:MAG: hypothetical protein NT096_00695, partial [Proteobacteria bacterium]|nr:hypothetical protein [Pseudomonadota bacterium]
QIRRIVKRIRDEGDKGIQHRSRGKESNRRLPKKLVERVTRLYQERYQQGNPGTPYCREIRGHHTSLIDKKRKTVSGLDL